jgi:GWxTD domain-containing protein
MSAPARGATNLSLLLFAGLAGSLFGCASTQSMSTYKMVPPADLSYYAATTEPFPGLDAPAPGQSTTEWTTSWLQGPVSSLVTREEAQRFNELDTDVEREEFIRLFWHRRNPEPEQEYNESLAEFRRRVEVANTAFGSGDAPGWRTPFGRALILLGFPTIIRVGDQGGPRATHTVAIEAEGGERVFWQYGLLPEDLAGTSLEAARAWAPSPRPGPGPARSPQMSPHFITFSFVRGFWSVGCGQGWRAHELVGGWGAVFDPYRSSSGNMAGGTSSSSQALSPIAGAAGPVGPGGGLGSTGFRASRGMSRFGPGCGDVFAAARANWLYNTVYYP